MRKLSSKKQGEMLFLHEMNRIFGFTLLLIFYMPYILITFFVYRRNNILICWVYEIYFRLAEFFKRYEYFSSLKFFLVHFSLWDCILLDFLPFLRLVKNVFFVFSIIFLSIVIQFKFITVQKKTTQMTLFTLVIQKHSIKHINGHKTRVFQMQRMLAMMLMYVPLTTQCYIYFFQKISNRRSRLFFLNI